MSLRFVLGALAGALLGVAVLISATGLAFSASAGPFTLASPSLKSYLSDQSAMTSGTGTESQAPGHISSVSSMPTHPSSLQSLATQPVFVNAIVLLPVLFGVAVGLLLYRGTKPPEEDAQDSK